VWDAVLERQAGPTLTRSGAEERMLALVDGPHAVVARLATALAQPVARG